MFESLAMLSLYWSRLALLCESVLEAISVTVSPASSVPISAVLSPVACVMAFALASDD